jgi:hypothetical protein
MEQVGCYSQCFAPSILRFVQSVQWFAQSVRLFAQSGPAFCTVGVLVCTVNAMGGGYVSIPDSCNVTKKRPRIR